MTKSLAAPPRWLLRTAQRAAARRQKFKVVGVSLANCGTEIPLEARPCLTPRAKQFGGTVNFVAAVVAAWLRSACVPVLSGAAAASSFVPLTHLHVPGSSYFLFFHGSASRSICRSAHDGPRTPLGI